MLQTSSQAEAMRAFLLEFQDRLCEQLIEADGGEHAFIEDAWDRPQGGGGRTRVIADAGVFEKGGVNFSDVAGDKLPPSATANRPEIAGSAFRAMGVSLVLHPRNPYIPTSHMNVRYFESISQTGAPVWWFGGGFDCTPYYGFKEDAVHWHQQAQAACLPFGDALYPRFKNGVMTTSILNIAMKHAGLVVFFMTTSTKAVLTMHLLLLKASLSTTPKPIFPSLSAGRMSPMASASWTFNTTAEDAT